MKKREEFFNKEIANFKKKEQTLLKRLEKIDPPKETTDSPERIRGRTVQAAHASAVKADRAAIARSMADLSLFIGVLAILDFCRN
jgi:hypothetical protein